MPLGTGHFFSDLEEEDLDSEQRPSRCTCVWKSHCILPCYIDSSLTSKIVCVRAILEKYCHRWSRLKASVVDYVVCRMLHHRHVASEWI